MAMLKLLERMGRADLTVHGFRSTFRDWAGERTNFPNEVVEMVLAHVVENKAEASYRRATSSKSDVGSWISGLNTARAAAALGPVLLSLVAEFFQNRIYDSAQAENS